MRCVVPCCRVLGCVGLGLLEKKAIPALSNGPLHTHPPPSQKKHQKKQSRRASTSRSSTTVSKLDQIRGLWTRKRDETGQHILVSGVRFTTLTSTPKANTNNHNNSHNTTNNNIPSLSLSHHSHLHHPQPPPTNNNNHTKHPQQQSSPPSPRTSWGRSSPSFSR